MLRNPIRERELLSDSIFQKSFVSEMFNCVKQQSRLPVTRGLFYKTFYDCNLFKVAIS